MQRWFDGAVYYGSWQNNTAHGLGRFVHSDGDVYRPFAASKRAFLRLPEADPIVFYMVLEV